MSNTTRSGKSVSEIPPPFQCIFPFSFFNAIQSECFELLFCTDSNVVIGAPTGSGKTVCFELAIVRLLQKQRTQESDEGEGKQQLTHKQKIIYLAPIKALCQERLTDWQNKFGPLGVKCVELTGDTENLQYQSLLDTDIIMTTPEKWDSVTRKWKEVKFLVGQVSLLLIDEVHLLHEDRGATLEAVVSRMKTISTSSSMKGTPSEKLRFIALSASVPNIEDIAAWLNIPSGAIKSFSEDYRPVKLELKVLAYPNAKNSYIFDRNLNYKIFDVIKQYNPTGKATLVFCSSRRGTSSAATTLVKEFATKGNPFIMGRQHAQRLQEYAKRISDKVLADCITKGVGYHNAGMDHKHRKLIEELFIKGDIKVLFSTSSLSQGVNLPAHLVIIKSTEQWNSHTGFTEYNPIVIHQMIGRAGRPQFGEISAVAVVMTKLEHKQKYEDFLLGRQKIESNLHKQMIEHLNAEIALGTITDIAIALEWIKSTYLYVRMRKNPVHYGIPKNLMAEKLEYQLKEICNRHIKDLESHGMIRIQDDNLSVVPLEMGRCMAKYYIQFETMKSFARMTPESEIKDLLYVVSYASEMSDVILRRTEKKILNAINSKIRFPLEGRFVNNAMKVNCLIQAALGAVPIEDYAMRQESFIVVNNAARIMLCMIQFLIEKKYFTALKNAILL